MVAGQLLGGEQVDVLDPVCPVALKGGRALRLVVTDLPGDRVPWTKARERHSASFTSPTAAYRSIEPLSQNQRWPMVTGFQRIVTPFFPEFFSL